MGRGATLKTLSGGVQPAAQLWEDRPAVVMVVRRFGCQLCRAGAKSLMDKRAEFEAIGVNMVAVVRGAALTVAS